MNLEEMLNQLRQTVMDGDPEQAEPQTSSLLSAGVDPLIIIDRALVPGIQYAGEQFSIGEFFLPDLMMAADAMQKALNICEPELHRRGTQRKSLGRIVMGTVFGDIHEIGKNLVGTLLSANGFEVFDLGVNVPIQTFVDKAQELNAQIIGISALLTTTMDGQRKVIETLKKMELRASIKVMVGGAPVTQGWASEIGADGYSEDAIGAVVLAKHLLGIAA